MAVYQHDKEHWVKQAVNSILSQEYQRFAFIIVIDGEISISLQSLLDEFCKTDERIVLAKCSVNNGLAAAMNYAIEWGLQYQPEFFARMDADDVAYPNRLSRQINYLKSHHQIAILGSALEEINESGRRVGQRVMPTSHKRIVRMLPRRCTMNHPTVTIRYTVFRDGNRYNANLKNTQDYFFWIALARQGYVFRNLKDKLLSFRRVNNFYKRRGISKSINEFKARFQAMKELKRFTILNVIYACGVLTLRLMPSKIVKAAYKLDRILLDKFLKH
ncbi:glycosyltransferase [Alteromonas ponticola]|uniref:Glycosyltransferase n=1 Tax=Alteromonas ponticola TaxID=2720613 RepID=A0ABX1R0Y6_9ALTE|nr:glycosyltransferase [Alteromonas ponticola]NMH59739.1 glycosyltransferase [Alteromonas ponticola]